jgi:hypothetical protein
MFRSSTFFVINVNTFTLTLGFPMVERPKKILDQLRDVIRLKHYSYRTEQTYIVVLNRGGQGVLSPLDACA